MENSPEKTNQSSSCQGLKDCMKAHITHVGIIPKYLEQCAHDCIGWHALTNRHMTVLCRNCKQALSMLMREGRQQQLSQQSQDSFLTPTMNVLAIQDWDSTAICYPATDRLHMHRLHRWTQRTTKRENRPITFNIKVILTSCLCEFSGRTELQGVNLYRVSG